MGDSEGAVKTLGGIFGLVVVWVWVLTLFEVGYDYSHPSPAISHHARLVTKAAPKTIWTPYNPECTVDCYPDLTPDWMGKVSDYYAGSLVKPLPPAPLDHYACEYMHIAGYEPGIEQCKGVR